MLLEFEKSLKTGPAGEFVPAQSSRRQCEKSGCFLTQPNVRFYDDAVTWAEVIRKLKAAGFVEVRSGKGSHMLLKHPATGKEVWVAVHTKKDAGRLGNRILREAGVE